MTDRPRAPSAITADLRALGLAPDDLRRFSEALRAMPMRQGRRERALRLVMRAWCRLVDWRVDVEGMASLPRLDGGAPGAGCVVAAAPHRAWVEPFLLLSAWPPDAARLVWLADGRTVTRSGWRRRLLPRVGIIPIAGSPRSLQAYVDLAAIALDAGAALVVFPEVGPPSAADRTRRISRGFAYIAGGTGASVIPVVVGGTHRIVRGSSFSVAALDALEVGQTVPDVFTRASRERAHALAHRYEEVINAALPAHTARADARAPERERWSWLARLLG